MKLIAIFLSFFFFVQPAFAIYPGKQRPVYLREINYIIDSNCKAVAIIPYEGMSYYKCPSGEDFWSDVLVGTDGSPLFMMFKNRKKIADDDTTTDANAVSTSVIMY
jgi:hypothetical protein